MRVRDEMRMTIEAYQALYCSSIAFGMRKALQSEQGKSDLQKDVEDLREEKTDLERQLTDLRQRAEQADRRAAELRLAEEKKHGEEIAFLKKTNQQLKVKYANCSSSPCRAVFLGVRLYYLFLFSRLSLKEL